MTMAKIKIYEKDGKAYSIYTTIYLDFKIIELEIIHIENNVIYLAIPHTLENYFENYTNSSRISKYFIEQNNADSKFLDRIYLAIHIKRLHKEKCNKCLKREMEYENK